MPATKSQKKSFFPDVPFYLDAREKYLRARARHDHAEESLVKLLGAKDAGSDLDMKMLEARSKGQHSQAILDYTSLGMVLDEASRDYDLATEQQQLKIRQQQEELDDDFRNLDE